MITEAEPGGRGLKPRNEDSLNLKEARDVSSLEIPQLLWTHVDFRLPAPEL